MKTSAEKGLAAFAAHTHARGQDGGRRGVGGDDLHSMEGTRYRRLILKLPYICALHETLNYIVLVHVSFACERSNMIACEKYG